MPAGYLPDKDEDLAAWTENFETLGVATPTAFGLTAPQMTAYATANNTWQTALATSTNPITRTPVTVAAKDTARAAIVALSRQYAGIVQSFPTITSGQLTSLGLTVRNTTRTPVPVPVTFPLIGVISTQALTLTLAISDETTPTNFRRPYGLAGCEIYTKTGGTAPVALTDCVFRGLATRYPARFELPMGAAGQTIWIIGRWINRRSQGGPMSSVVSAILAS